MDPCISNLHLWWDLKNHLSYYLEIHFSVSHSWNQTSVGLYSSQLLVNASVATAMAVEMLPEFGVNVSSIRSVGVINVRNRK